MAQVIEIEGIGEVFAQKLSEAGVATVERLLSEGASPKGRAALAEKTGISGTLLLKWINRADLFRVKGVGTQYSDLLEAAGVDTVVELAHRKPENLLAKLVEVNDAKKLVTALPTLEHAQAWIEHAKTLPRVLTY